MDEELIFLDAKQFSELVLNMRRINKNRHDLYEVFANGLNCLIEDIESYEKFKETLNRNEWTVFEWTINRRKWIFDKLVDKYKEKKESYYETDIFDGFYLKVPDWEIINEIAEYIREWWILPKRIIDEFEEEIKDFVSFVNFIDGLFCGNMREQENCKEILVSLLSIKGMLIKIGGCT